MAEKWFQGRTDPLDRAILSAEIRGERINDLCMALAARKDDPLRLCDCGYNIEGRWLSDDEKTAHVIGQQIEACAVRLHNYIHRRKAERDFTGARNEVLKDIAELERMATGELWRKSDRELLARLLRTRQAHARAFDRLMGDWKNVMVKCIMQLLVMLGVQLDEKTQWADLWRCIDQIVKGAGGYKQTKPAIIKTIQADPDCIELLECLKQTPGQRPKSRQVF